MFRECHISEMYSTNYNQLYAWALLILLDDSKTIANDYARDHETDCYLDKSTSLIKEKQHAGWSQTTEDELPLHA